MERVQRFGLRPASSERVGGLGTGMGVAVALVATLGFLLTALGVSVCLGLAGLSASVNDGLIAILAGSIVLGLAFVGFRAVNSGVVFEDGVVAINGILRRRTLRVGELRGFSRHGTTPYAVLEDGSKVRITGLAIWGSPTEGSRFIDEGLDALNERLQRARS